MRVSIKNLDPEKAFQPIPDLEVYESEDFIVGEQMLDSSSDPFLLALEMSAAPLFLFSPEGDIVFANVAGTEYVADFKAEDHMEFSNKVRAVLFGMDEGDVEAQGRFGGDKITIRSVPFGGETLFSAQMEPLPDISDDELQYLAYHDELTGMKNFRAYNNALETIRKNNEISKSSEIISMILIDVDDFKSVNDSWGHKFGNKVLEEIGSFFKQSIRSGDQGFRIGGDEFAILSYQDSTDKASEWATRIHQDLTAHIRQKTGNESISISMGCALLDDKSLSEKSFFEKADQTLYHAKDSGKAQVVIQ